MKLVKHSLYNLVGLGLPLIVALFTIPILIRELGDAKFGLLTLIWALVSYFGLFDLGLSRALTQQLASTLDGPNHKDSGQIITTSLVLMAILGLVACFIMYIFGPIGLDYIKGIPDKDEALNSIYVMALAMPFILITSGLRGILEAKHHFGVINVIRLPMGIFTFIGPVISLIFFGANLAAITIVLVAGRFIGFIAYGLYAWDSTKNSHGKFSFNTLYLKPLLLSGNWFTISNVISPLMGYIDRYMISVLISPSAVAYYVTPQELITKISIIPASINAVLFPKFSKNSEENKKENKFYYNISIKLIYFIVLPITSIAFIFSYELLTIWVDSNFASKAYKLAQIFSIGILINCLSQLPYTLIQGIGLPKITAMIHTAELPFFLVLLLVLINKYGILGAGFAWLLRILVDAAILFYITGFKSDLNDFSLNLRLILCCLFITALSFSGVLIESFALKITWVFFLVSISVYKILTYINELNNRNN